MDVDVVLNACLETYQTDDIEKSKKSRQMLLESRSTYLFKDGKRFAEIIEITMNPSRSVTPIYSVGSSGPTDYIPGRPTIEGTFTVRLDGEQYRTLNPNFQIEHPNYFIEVYQLYSDGSSSRVRILDITISEQVIQHDPSIPNRSTYSYRGSLVEHTNIAPKVEI